MKLKSIVVALFCTVAPMAFAADEPPATGNELVFRRLSADQYRQIIADVFGASIKIGGRFEPDLREDGLLAVGSSRVSVTPSGLEQYDIIARNIAAQVVSEANRDTLIPCKPAQANAPDDACARQFLARAGELLFRRPLTDEELTVRAGIADAAATSLKDFYAGIQTALSDLLVSPQFLFRREFAEPDPRNPGQYRLTLLSQASRLSFLLWNTAPDPDLLADAKSGRLADEKVLAAHVDRMLKSPRLGAGVRAFFVDMLEFERFDTLAKDAAIYPNFTADVAREAQEQTLRTIVDLTVTQRGDYRDLFTTRRTFLTPLLGSVYKVPVVDDKPNGAPDAWQLHEFPEGDPRIGILSHASFVALHSHPGRSSPTLRGRALRTILLCQKVPDPPGNVNFTVVQDTSNPIYKTARERLNAHATEAMCTGCHKIIDPMGLTLEQFDSSGSFRTAENGVPIDVSGQLDQIKFTGAAGLGQAVHDYPNTPVCLANKLFSYAVGRPVAKGEAEWMKYLINGFAADQYRIPALLRRIALSENFTRVSGPSQQAASLDLAKEKRP